MQFLSQIMSRLIKNWFNIVTNGLYSQLTISDKLIFTLVTYWIDCWRVTQRMRGKGKMVFIKYLNIQILVKNRYFLEMSIYVNKLKIVRNAHIIKSVYVATMCIVSFPWRYLRYQRMLFLKCIKTVSNIIKKLRLI